MGAKTSAAVADQPSTTKRRIFLVDDHPIVRQGLAMLIDHEADLEVAGQGEDIPAALRGIRSAHPDLVLLDVSLKDGDGIELLKELKVRDPNLPVLMLSMHDETLYAERALRSGARGYVMKQEAPAVLLAAIRKVLDGQIYVSGRMSATMLQRMVVGKRAQAVMPMDRLTDRELEIFRLIGQGETMKQIAAKLFLSVKTVEAHREHIKDKLGLRSAAELLRYAIRNAPDAA